MSVDNETDGYLLYKEGKEDTNSWFHKQWKHWPERVDSNNTTNLSFLYGGIRAYREINKKEPELSKDLKSSIEFLDKYRDEHEESV